MSKNKDFHFDGWSRLLECTRVPKHIVNDLVMDYFLSEGFVDVAQAFQEEALVGSHDVEQAERRNLITRAVLSGDLELAIRETHRLAPGLLDSRPELLFQLQKQSLLKLILAGQVPEAIAFAQNEIAPIVEESTSMRKELQEVLALLIFEDVRQNPLSHLLDQKHLHDVSAQLNSAILEHHGHSSEARVVQLVREAYTAQTKLESHQIPHFKLLRQDM